MTIKSKMALELARKKFGENAAVCCQHRRYFVGKLRGGTFGLYCLDAKGDGKSWELALRDAGVPIPDAPYFPVKVPAAVPSNGIADDLVTEAMGGGE